MKATILLNDCWLTPEGNIIYVGFCGHNDFASKYLQEEAGSSEAYCEKYHSSGRCAYEFLHDRGWIRIMIRDSRPKIRILGNCIDLTRPMLNTIDPPMNEIQKEIALRFCRETGTSFHEAIHEKIFW